MLILIVNRQCCGFWFVIELLGVSLQGCKNFQDVLLKNNFKTNKSRKFICRFNDSKLERKFKKNSWYFTMGDTLEIY